MLAIDLDVPDRLRSNCSYRDGVDSSYDAVDDQHGTRIKNLAATLAPHTFAFSSKKLVIESR